MVEIDDIYKQEVENLDLNFLEEMETVKDRGKSLKKYRESLRKSRDKFERGYRKFNAKEKKRLLGLKKKAPKQGKFKHLVIAHFDFGFGFWARFRMRWDIRLFNFMRKVRRFNAWIFPKWFVYFWYKVRNFFKYLWRDIIEIKDIAWGRLKDSSIKAGIWIWGALKVGWKKVVFLGGKVMFWRKAPKVEEKGKEGEGGEGEEKKEEGEEKVKEGDKGEGE